MDEAQRQIVDDYAQNLYRKFIKPWYADVRRGGVGFNQMANGGISELALCRLERGSKVGIEDVWQNIQGYQRIIFHKHGYININSFRGVRGFWYHTYGVNSALAVLGLAEAWKVDVPEVVVDRVRKSVELINLGVTVLDRFYARKFSGYRGNASTNPKHARPHIHQMAIAIDAMAERYVNVTLEHDATYLRKRRYEGPSDFTVGFHPGCMIRQGASS